ncbi:MAG: response regulator [Kofleriaceae bacterium]
MSEILVVDDSYTVRMDLSDALVGAGYVVRAAADLAEARALLANHSILLAILDVRLPDGDGTDLAREIRSNPKYGALPILMLSSEAEVGDRIRGLQMGANDYVGKPYDTEFVLARVRQLVPTAAVNRLVLVIDDSLTFREGLAWALQQQQYDVISAASGTDGLRLASARQPGAIIVDGIMPDMAGDAVIRRIRLDSALRATPCLLLTGSDDAMGEISALDAGADAFARKSSDLEVIIARFTAMVRSAGERAIASAVGPKRVLVVDDSPTYLHALANDLLDDGYDVAQATSGVAAIELLGVQPVDCVVLDLEMPVMSGIEACKRIKDALHNTPIVLVSSRDDRTQMLDALAAGADDVIVKEAGTEVVAARVKAQIRRKRFADEQRQVRERLLRSEAEATEARAARQLAEARASLAGQLARSNTELAAANRELAAANRELEAFSYSVSHDLRAPLRSIRSFSQMIEEDAGPTLDATSKEHLARVIAATGRMSDLIDAMLELSRISRVVVQRTPTDLGPIANAVVEELRQRDPGREVAVTIQRDLAVSVDPRMARALFDNVIGNAWKFTGKVARPTIDVGKTAEGFFVRDNGAGFDMATATHLFAPFQRMHGGEFPGTGVGLATVRRICERHGGRVWADSKVGQGTTIFFTLPDPIDGK